MKPRLVAYVALVSLAIGTAALSSRIALAQGGQGSPGQQSEQDRGKHGGQLSEQIDKALQAYEERMDRNLDQCRKELDQMKKELHDLIDLRINMALSVAELRAKSQMQGGGFGGGPYASQRPVADGSGYRPVAEGSRGGGSMRGDGEGLTRELQQIHNQLRSEIDQQQGQVTQLAAQLRGMQAQSKQAEQSGQGQGQDRGQRRGQGQGQGAGQGQGQGQDQGQGQGGPRGPREGRRGQQQQPGQQFGQPLRPNTPGQGGGQPGQP
jgi:polyhydroxyalkanoate synthesis regulator phasin